MWGYGLRISEVLNIKKEDLKASDLVILEKEIKVELSSFIRDIKSFKKLNEISSKNVIDNDFVFLGSRGKKLKAEIIQRLIRNIRNELMLHEKTSPHSFRHTLLQIF